MGFQVVADRCLNPSCLCGVTFRKRRLVRGGAHGQLAEINNPSGDEYIEIVGFPVFAPVTRGEPEFRITNPEVFFRQSAEADEPPWRRAFFVGEGAGDGGLTISKLDIIKGRIHCILP
jgi:hypothetical protein